jgi:hypothetical protein
VSEGFIHIAFEPYLIFISMRNSNYRYSFSGAICGGVARDFIFQFSDKNALKVGGTGTALFE